jgi:hypothetical protein
MGSRESLLTSPTAVTYQGQERKACSKVGKTSFIKNLLLTQHMLYTQTLVRPVI